MEILLSGPAGKFRRTDICGWIYDRLPDYYKKHINRLSIGRSFNRLRM